MTGYDKITELFQENRNDFTLIHGGGSDRQYWRYKPPQGPPVILVQYTARDDIQIFTAMTDFLRRSGVPVQKVLHVDVEQACVLIEDLGDDSLYTYYTREHTRSHNRLLPYYQVIDALAHMQHTCAPAFRKTSHAPVFDYAKLTWETDYFLQRFVSEFRGLTRCLTPGLKQECQQLARTVDTFPKFFMHRDFQSQNIILKDGTPYFIDYQTAHIGPHFYDIASLLKDPYVNLTADTENILLTHYYSRITGNYRYADSHADFLHQYTLTSLQRIMQALGAYAFLSRHKKKGHFEQHIPAAVNILKRSLHTVDGFPELTILVEML